MRRFIARAIHPACNTARAGNGPECRCSTVSIHSASQRWK
jgi:hypothetical protein